VRGRGWPVFCAPVFDVIDRKTRPVLWPVSRLQRARGRFPCDHVRWSQRIQYLAEPLDTAARRVDRDGQWVSASGFSDDFDPIQLR